MPTPVPAGHGITTHEAAGEPTVEESVAGPAGSRHLFGGKKQLEGEVADLRAQLKALGVTEREQLVVERQRLRDELPAMRAERESLARELAPLRAEAATLEAAHNELDLTRRDLATAQSQLAAAEHSAEQYRAFEHERAQAQAELAALRSEIVETEETAILQEAGIYRYRHPLDDAVAYKARLSGIQAQIKDAVKAGNAVKGATNWTVNGSTAAGNRMVREFSKLMLRAYNAEADNAVRSMKPYTLESAVAKLVKARDTIVKLGGTMNIRVTDHYHQLRVTELELTADFLAKQAEEKEKERAEKERLRDEERARREIEREQERLRKEQEHYSTVLAAYQAQGNHRAAAEAESKLTEIADGLDGLSRRAANIRAGYVYVISNIGAFGPRMVKVGMTRRLDPMDRVRELGDASVPFRYDVHTLVFSDDAVGLETHLHHALAAERVNMVNNRREFFFATPSEVRDILLALDLPMLSYVDEPEAVEWHQSETARHRQPAPGGTSGL